jgi:hypothetical protein
MTTTLWVALAITCVNVALFFATRSFAKDTSYYAAWSDVYAALREHADGARKEDLDAIARVYGALGAAFGRSKKP